LADPLSLVDAPEASSTLPMMAQAIMIPGYTVRMMIFGFICLSPPVTFASADHQLINRDEYPKMNLS